MTDLKKSIDEALGFIRTHTKEDYPIGIILGTGLGGLGREIAVDLSLDYEQIPHFPVSTVESHHGKLIFGTLGGKKVVAMQGRFHYYEATPCAKSPFPCA